MDFLAPSQGREIKYHRAAKEWRSQRGTLADETKRILLGVFFSLATEQANICISCPLNEQGKACVHR